MPKLRNATTDVGAMTQYLARKCVIHAPHAELDVPVETGARAKLPRFGKPKRKSGAVHLLAERGSTTEPNQFVAISPQGRAIRVTVEEINPNTLDPALFKKVGS